MMKIENRERTCLWLQVQASRGRKDPRKQQLKEASVSIARSRSKSCRETERGSSESDPFASPPAGECGGKNQVRRALRILKGKRNLRKVWKFCEVWKKIFKIFLINPHGREKNWYNKVSLKYR